MTLDLFAFYVLPLAAILTIYSWSRRRHENAARAIQHDSIGAGLGEPSTLHPVIDASLCIGCKACLNACPEGDILGLINNKAALIEPSNCIGHGACKTACPRGAISLVFGTETRGVELPVVDADFESNVPGIFIAGELGGMGLIRNAVEQGRLAMDAIAARSRKFPRSTMLDVVIVGSGPAGLAASLAALEKRLAFVTLEQDTLGGSIAHFPRGKVVMTAPAELPLVGKFKFKEISKEALLTFWQDAVARTGLRINVQERVEHIVPVPGGFAIQTPHGSYAARSVLLAIGRRGTPRRLGVPGEELPKVSYRLTDPEQYRGQHILVAGGGDSALEAALALCASNRVTLAYRGEALAKAKVKNRKLFEAACAAGTIEPLFKTTVTQIAPDRVILSCDGHTLVRRNDAVIVCAGGVLPTDFLRRAGIELETKYGTA